MTFDFEALQKAVHAELVALSEKEDEESALSAAFRAYLKATNSVIVPVEPTGGMVNAGGYALQSYAAQTMDAARIAYRAMLQASQEGEE